MNSGRVFMLGILTVALAVFFGCVEPDLPPEEEYVKKVNSLDYKAQVGDILQIKAFPDPEELITGDTYEVASDGSIKLIYLGHVFVEGKTKAEIEAEIEKRYSSYYKDITITVTILRFYYVSGEVRQPSRYQLVRRTRLTEAIDTAGGFTDFAKESGVSITRIVNGKPVKKRYNCKKIRKGKSEDPVILPDDRIYVPRGGL